MTSMQWFSTNKLLIVLALLGCQNAWAAAADDANTTEVVNYRLDRNVIPSHYDLKLYPVFDNDTFSGSVVITVDVQDATDSITLHTNALTYNTVAVQCAITGIQVNGTSYEIITDDRQFLIINFGTTLPAGAYNLVFDFHGPLDSGIVGFYDTTISTGQKIAASILSPTYARQAFPCFDEPDFKSTFDITLVTPSNYTALSNMDEMSSEVDGDLTTVKFNTSPAMSTSFVGFVVSDFEYVENTVKTSGIGDEFPLRSYGSADQLSKVEFAQELALRLTEYFIKYYNIPFPLPKLDMIGIPDYVTGGMENWGLLSFQEYFFLIDNVTSSSANRRNVGETVSQEIAFMWFGNLVTLEWWDNLWVQAGFATYMQDKALDAINPEWTMLAQFLTRNVHIVMQLDATSASHPLAQAVETPDEISAIFDTVTYWKGAAVMRMVEGFMGEENFQLGVTDYLNQHAYDTANAQDFLNSLEPYFGQDSANLTYIVDTWTRQMGFPIITVTPGSAANTFVLTQSRFLADLDAQSNDTSDYNFRWYVPITYKTANGIVNTITWFPDTSDSVEIDVGEGYSWLKINNDEVGFYRVNYTQDMWQSLMQELSAADTSLTISDRANLIDEAFQQAFARTVSYKIPLQLSEYLSTEMAFAPWNAAADNFRIMRRRLVNSEIYETFKKFVSNLIQPVYDTLSWKEDKSSSLINGLLRMEVLDAACAHGHEDALAQARTLFTAWLASNGVGVVVEADLRDIVFYYGMASATEEEWDSLWALYLVEDDAQERDTFLDALAGPQNVTLLTKYLNLSWENVRDQDYLDVLIRISANPAGTALIWDFVRSNWERLVERFTLNSLLLGDMLPRVTRTFNTEAKLEEMEAFFALYPDEGAGANSRAQALENVRNNIKWTELNEPTVAAWLNATLSG